jgi:glycosidase
MRYAARPGKRLYSALTTIAALTVIAGCGDATTDPKDDDGYPQPPPPAWDAGGAGGTGGSGGTGAGGSGGSGAQPPGKDGGSDAAPDRRQDSSIPPDTSGDGGGSGGSSGAGGSGGTGGSGGVAGSGGAAGSGGSGGNDGGNDAGDGGGSPFSWSDGMIYYIFVDRFLDSNPQNNCVVPNVSPSEVGDPFSPAQYRGGDWAGITAKINEGYFDSLGVNAIMITSPMTNVMTAGQGIEGDTHFYSAYHGYWPTDVNPATPSSCFGSPSDLTAMVSAAHLKGLKVLFDHTIVHVHDSSPVYQQHKDWFWTNNGQPWCTCGTANCGWDPVTEEGARCWFTSYLPHWNYGAQGARDFAVKMTVDWINQYNIDGLRLDAIKHVDEQWLLDTRKAVTAEISSKRPPNRPLYLVGETVDGNIATISRFVDPVTKLDGQFDFPARAQIVGAILRRSGQMSDLASWMDQHANDYAPGSVMSTMLGTHDMMRVIHHAENTPIGNGEWDDGKGASKVAGWTTKWPEPGSIEPYERLANGFALIFTNKGAPLIYYGDEVGLAGAGDPDNRRMMPWSNLTPHQQWLRERLTKLVKLRAQHPATRRGTRATVIANKDVWAYTLTAGNDTLFVAINRGDEVQSVTLPAGNWNELLEGGTSAGAVSIPARQARIYRP